MEVIFSPFGISPPFTPKKAYRPSLAFPFHPHHFFLLVLRLLSLAPLANASIFQTTIPGIGTIAGKSHSNGTCVMYLGVPFATQPVGDLRWQEPLPPPPFPANSTLDATSFGPLCPQPGGKPFPALFQQKRTKTRTPRPERTPCQAPGGR
jgi:hypothetical protein